MESQVVPQLGYDYVGLNVKGLAGNPLKKAYAALLFVKSIGKAKKVIKKFNPDIVVGLWISKCFSFRGCCKFKKLKR